MKTHTRPGPVPCSRCPDRARVVVETSGGIESVCKPCASALYENNLVIEPVATPIYVVPPANVPAGQKMILVTPIDDGGIVSWNDGRDRLEFGTWEEAESFALTLQSESK